MGNCARLKFARKEMKLTQQQFADKTGVSIGTIARLETDETAWDTVQDSTFDKVMNGLEGNGYWLKKEQLKRHGSDEPEHEPVAKIVDDDAPSWAKGVVTMLNQSENKKDDKDGKILEMLEFVMEGLRESESHEEFAANLKIMKRILKKF